MISKLNIEWPKNPIVAVRLTFKRRVADNKLNPNLWYQAGLNDNEARLKAIKAGYRLRSRMCRTSMFAL